MLPLVITVYLTELCLILIYHVSMSTTASLLDGRFIKKSKHWSTLWSREICKLSSLSEFS